MKTPIILGVSLAIAMVSLARADQSITPFTLGVVDAVFGFCRHVNPAGAPAYRQLRVAMIGKQSERKLEDFTHSAEYRNAFTVVRTVLRDGLPQNQALKACQDIIPAGGRR